MDDVDRLRLRRSGFVPPESDLAVGGTPRFLGRIVSTGANLGVGKFLLVNPSEALGSPVEGGPAMMVVDTARTVPVYLAGPGVPSTGDYVVCRFADYRWTCTWRGGTGTPPIVIGIPGCFCQQVPTTLNLTVTYGSNETASTYGNAYKPCSLAYYPAGSPPPYIPLENYPGAGFYSTTAWVDDYGFTDYYRLSCFASQFSLGFGQYGGGLWQSPGQLFNWAMGSRNPVNFCDPGQPFPGSGPFALNVGQTQPGIFFNGKFVVTG